MPCNVGIMLRYARSCYATPHATLHLTPTCVVAAVQPAVVVAHGVQVVQRVGGAGGGRGRAGGGLAAAPLDHVGRHVQAGQGEGHQRGELGAPRRHLPEALEVQDEDVRQRPQTHLHHALLQLEAVGAAPRIIRGQLGGGGEGGGV